MRWKIFQWMKLLFRHSSNSRKLSRQKFHNELACVFTAHHASKNADWNQQQLTEWPHFGQSEQRKSSVLFPIQSEKSPYSGFFTCDPTKKCIMPSSRERHKGIIGRGHDLRLLFLYRFPFTSSPFPVPVPVPIPVPIPDSGFRLFQTPVIFLDFHSTKQGLQLVDSWSRGLA